MSAAGPGVGAGPVVALLCLPVVVVAHAVTSGGAVPPVFWLAAAVVVAASWLARPVTARGTTLLALGVQTGLHGVLALASAGAGCLAVVSRGAGAGIDAVSACAPGTAAPAAPPAVLAAALGAGVVVLAVHLGAAAGLAAALAALADAARAVVTALGALALLLPAVAPLPVCRRLLRAGRTPSWVPTCADLVRTAPRRGPPVVAALA